MAQDNTVSFKAYLLQGDTNEKSEVRRFGIDRDVVSSFDYLKEKLQLVFPNIRNQNFSIMWKDADNDFVAISTDDELMIALSEMQNEVRKLYIKVLDTSVYPPNTEAADLANEAPDNAHKGVICDVCNQQIEGFRYHCTECFNYDLCGTCEAKKMHDEHIMMRLPSPVSASGLSGYVHQVIAHLNSFNRRHGHDRRHSHDRYGKGKGNPSRPGFDYTIRTKYCRCLIDEESECPAEKHKEAREKLKAKADKSTKAHSKKREYLWSVGQQIVDLLDPLGIDVDVAVLTRDENENKSVQRKKEEEKMETEETERNGVQNKDLNCNAAEVSNKAGPSQEAYVTNTAARIERANPETEDWTVLNAAPQVQQQENYNAADWKYASGTSSYTSSDGDQTSLIKVQLDGLHMLSDPDDRDISGPCDRGRKRKNDAEWKKKHGPKKGDIGNLKKLNRKQRGSEIQKKNGPKRSGSESQKKHDYKSFSENWKKRGHKNQRNNGNLPGPTVAATPANKRQNGTERPACSIAGVPIQVGAATSVNQVQSGVGVPSTSRVNPYMFPVYSLSGMQSSGAGAPTHTGIEMSDLTSDLMFGGHRTIGMPTSRTNAPVYAGARVPSTAVSRDPNVVTDYYLDPNPYMRARQMYNTLTKPHVLDAVQKMMAMGFSNEGGWLTQLLEIKNGDIEKALDVLQPVKRS